VRVVPMVLYVCIYIRRLIIIGRLAAAILLLFMVRADYTWKRGARLQVTFYIIYFFLLSRHARHPLVFSAQAIAAFRGSDFVDDGGLTRKRTSQYGNV